MQIEYMLDDKNYIIIGMSAAIIKNNFEINDCKKEAKKISNEIKELFGESVKYQHDKMTKATADRSGKSISDARFYIFKDGSFVGQFELAPITRHGDDGEFEGHSTSNVAFDKDLNGNTVAYGVVLGTKPIGFLPKTYRR
mgnify:CR=1 FL=1